MPARHSCPLCGETATAGTGVRRPRLTDGAPDRRNDEFGILRRGIEVSVSPDGRGCGPAEPVVDTDLEQMDVKVTIKSRIGEGGSVKLETHEIVFDLCRPARREGVFQTGTDHPACVGVAGADNSSWPADRDI
jgi:hypothetical protein